MTIAKKTLIALVPAIFLTVTAATPTRAAEIFLKPGLEIIIVQPGYSHQRDYVVRHRHARPVWMRPYHHRHHYRHPGRGHSKWARHHKHRKYHKRHSYERSRYRASDWARGYYLYRRDR